MLHFLVTIPCIICTCHVITSNISGRYKRAKRPTVLCTLLHCPFCEYIIQDFANCMLRRSCH